MKTAEEYWDKFIAGRLDSFEVLMPRTQGLVRDMVAAIAADARADALAEAKPDPDEERAKAEWDRFRKIWMQESKGDGITYDTYMQRAFAAYVKTLPPRPMRSGAQRMRDADIKHGLASTNDPLEKLPPDHQRGYEAAAAELGIQPKE